MPLTKSSTPIKDFLPSSYKLQVEKEAQAAEERKKFSDGPGRYLRAPKEGKNPKSGKPEPGLLYTSPSPRDSVYSRMPSSA